MNKFHVKKLLSIIAVVILLMQFVIHADYGKNIIQDSLEIVESFSEFFLKPKEDLKPIGLSLKPGLAKNICIGFNSGLHQMSQIETLPLSFENPLIAEVPVLLYHHIIDGEGYGDNVISADLFEKHLLEIKKSGYNTVSAKELIDFVYYGNPLPEKPILISFDDGYMSNYELAYPIIKKHNMKAIIFAIGWAIGKDKYKETDKDIIPHFDFEHINEMTSSGLIEVQSHTFDMHQNPELEHGSIIRESVLKQEQETTEEYISALENDYKSFDKLLFNNTGYRNYAIAYPHGEYSEISEEVFKRLGTYITFSTEFRYKNILVQGDLDSLRALNRFTISEIISPAQLIKLIDSVYNEQQENLNE